MRKPDSCYADPRLAVLYDVFENDRADLDAYLGIAHEVGARTVIDVGCGTGSLAHLLAARGLDVVGVDPAVASLDVARAKPGSDRVRWVEGDAGALVGLDLNADLAVMTGNVAQVFVDDDDWSQTLAVVHTSLRPGGWFAFETRRPEDRAWQRWGQPPTALALPAGNTVVTSMTVTTVDPPLVTFESTIVVDGEPLTSSSTLRFRERTEVERDLAEHGFEVSEVRDALDRPGMEYVFLARRLSGPGSEEEQTPSS